MNKRIDTTTPEGVVVSILLFILSFINFIIKPFGI